jgi:hypothetical protein
MQTLWRASRSRGVDARACDGKKDHRMAEQGGTTTASPTHGCMACKAPGTYTVEPFAHGHTGWRCMVCGKILRLVPGTYTGIEAIEAAT